MTGSKIPSRKRFDKDPFLQNNDARVFGCTHISAPLLHSIDFENFSVKYELLEIPFLLNMILIQHDNNLPCDPPFIYQWELEKKSLSDVNLQRTIML